MVENTIYLATREVAERAGVYGTAYQVADGRFVIDSMDIRRIRLTGDEYMTGVSGIERISEQEAELLISENGYSRGEERTGNSGVTETTEAPKPAEEPAEEPAADEGSSSSGEDIDEGSSSSEDMEDGGPSGDTSSSE